MERRQGSGLDLLDRKDLTSLAISNTVGSRTQLNAIDNVEIIPQSMVFIDAYEGKEFTKTLTLRNIGNKSAMVKIGAPTAKTFRMEPMKKVCRLSPGLSLSRMIRMKYSIAFVVHDAQIPIYINGNTINYPLTIVLNQAKIHVEPTEIDFGRIDAVSSVAAKKVIVSNTGTKNAKFWIDLGRNELELIVEPTRGVLQACDSIELEIELMGFYEGPFQKEFWIKTEPPKRVTVTGEFITPKIVSMYPKQYTDFSIIIFPRLYIGQTSSRVLVIKNASSIDAMFCIRGVVDKRYPSYEDAILINDNYKNFRLNPLEGRLGSQQTSVVEIRFEPVEASEQHAVCFIQIMRVDWTDVDDSVIIRANDKLELPRLGLDTKNSLLPTATHSIQSNDSLEDPNIVKLVTEEKITEFETFRVCLYGDKERARVNFRPKTIALNEVQVDTVYSRDLWFENGSSYLPITVNYVKVPFVEVEPSKIFLKPKQSKEVVVKIRAKRSGAYSKKVEFELLIYEQFDLHKLKKVKVGHVNLNVSFEGVLTVKPPQPKFLTGITPKNHNEVGFLTEDISFNTKIAKMKSAILRDVPKVFPDDDSDLIAFPNDRPRSLRRWTSPKKCKTIFAKMPRADVKYDEYTYTPIILQLKKENQFYYNQVYKKNGNKSLMLLKIRESQEKTRKWMMKYYTCDILEEVGKKEKQMGFVPLLPSELLNIKVTPRYIRLRRVAPISNVGNNFTIQNDNPFSIIIYMTSVKPGIYFPQGHCKILRANEKKTIALTCFAGLVGRYINMIQVIVNFCHLFSISVMVEVVPKMINLEENVLTFEPEISGNIKFIELRNHLNSPILFMSETSSSRFTIEPSSGTILQKRSILCAIRYENVPELPDYCELVLRSEGGGSQLMQISRKKEKPKVEIFPKKLLLPNLPFNIETSYEVRIMNKNNYDICYFVVDPCPFEGVEITPFEGVIPGVTEIKANVTVINNKNLNFTTKFDFIFEDEHKLSLTVQGHVVLPCFDIRPESIVNRQLIPFAYRRNIFYLKNESTCEALVRFDLDQYEYFRVTEQEHEMDSTIHNTNLKLNPGEVKTLYLHFNPMDALTESFYIPIIMNDEIGPPLMSNEESTYFRLGTSETKLPRMRITSICGTVSLNFSTLKLSFLHAASDVPEQVPVKFFTAKNSGNDSVEFCLKIDNLSREFNVEYHSGAAVHNTTVALVCMLNPGESTIFAVRFTPVVPGNFTNEIPIHVRNYLNGCIFNYLRLVGKYMKPSITTEDICYYVGCVPVQFRASILLDLRMKYHEEHCSVACKEPPGEISVSFRERTVRKNKILIKTKIVVNCNKPKGIFADIEFYCSCHASHSIKLIALSDNCYLSHYAFSGNQSDVLNDMLELPKASTPEPLRKTRELRFSAVFVDLTDYPENKNVYNFPFFPLVEDRANDTAYHYRMKSTLKFVERWVSTQGFYKTKFYQIPYTIAMAPCNIKKKGKKQDTDIEPVILTFIAELGGEEVREASITSKINKLTEKNIALHFYTTYSNLLEYMEGLGAIIPHVVPELLLTYEYYEIMHEYKPNSLALKWKMDEEHFQRYSTRCYLDLILQSIKIFVLKTIRLFDRELSVEYTIDSETSESTLSSEVGKTTPISQSSHAISLPPNSNVYTKQEHLLLQWLQYHFDRQKTRLWKHFFIEGTQNLKPKDIKIFGEDLNDSLVFACVTASYCPYVIHSLVDMYVPPSTFEEYHHNACSIIRTWNLLKLSYQIEPNDIVKPNGVNMLLLTLYLYEILPTFHPKETLTLQAKLTQSTQANVTLSNPSEQPIVYAITFFRNESESFTSETEVFRLMPHRQGTFKITYQAKKISSQSAILVLSGELPGQKYGKSRAINLEGITDLNFLTKKIEFKCDMYSIHHKKIKLFSPYAVPDTYEVFYSITDEEHYHDEVELYSWKEYILGKIPKRMYTKKYTFEVADPKKGFMFEPIICCQMIPVRIYRMFMVGQQGDWCFEVRIVPKISKKDHEVVNVSLPRGFASQMCSCRFKSTEVPLICPRTIHINVMSKNNLFYKSTREMFIACTEEQFLAFSRKYLPMRAVINILNVLYTAQEPFSKLTEYQEVFAKNRRFDIFTEPNSNYTAQKFVIIEDTSSEALTEILIHANADFDPSVSTYLILESDTKFSRRYYKLNFYES